MTAGSMGDPSLAGLRITVSGQELPQRWLSDLIDLRVQRAVNSVGRAVLRFRDEGFTKASDAEGVFSFDSDVKIEAYQRAARGAGQTGILMQGTVVAKEVDADGGGQALAVTVHDRAAKLTGRTTAKTGLDRTGADLLGLILRERGISLEAPSGVTNKWLIYARSPLGIVQEVAQRAGWHWQMSDRKLVMWSAASGNAPAAKTVSVALGRELLSLNVRDVYSEPRDVDVHGWDHFRSEAVVAHATPANSRADIAFGVRQRNSDTGTVLVGHAPVENQNEAEEMAKALAGTGGRVIARGRSWLLPDLVPGGTVQIDRAGQLSGSYYVREVEHRVSMNGTWTEFHAGDRDAPQLTEPVPTPPAESARFDRLTVAVVTEIGNGEGDKPLGAVRVSFVALDNSIASHWAPVVQQGAGEGRGFSMMPEINDQVVVGFADGDLRRPIVLGGIYSSVAKPAPGKDLFARDGIAVHSLVTKNGDRIEVRTSDDATKHHVLISLKGDDHKIVLGEKGAEVSVPDGVPLTLASGRSKISFDGNGTITLQGTKIVVKAEDTAEITALKVIAKASAQAEISSGGQALLKGAATTVESSGPTAVKGAVVNLN